MFHDARESLCEVVAFATELDLEVEELIDSQIRVEGLKPESTRRSLLGVGIERVVVLSLLYLIMPQVHSLWNPAKQFLSLCCSTCFAFPATPATPTTSHLPHARSMVKGSSVTRNHMDLVLLMILFLTASLLFPEFCHFPLKQPHKETWRLRFAEATSSSPSIPNTSRTSSAASKTMSSASISSPQRSNASGSTRRALHPRSSTSPPSALGSDLARYRILPASKTMSLIKGFSRGLPNTLTRFKDSKLFRLPSLLAISRKMAGSTVHRKSTATSRILCVSVLMLLHQP